MAKATLSLPLVVIPTRDCKFLEITVSYAGLDASLYPFIGQLKFSDINGDYLINTIDVTIPTQYATTTITIPVDSLSITNGLVNIEFFDGATIISTYPILLHCDIDCCLSKLTNELIDCACDCAKCASALAKAQKIFLLIKSAEYALAQTQLANPGNISGYLTDAHNKYMKAKEICDNSCGCDC